MERASNRRGDIPVGRWQVFVLQELSLSLSGATSLFLFFPFVSLSPFVSLNFSQLQKYSQNGKYGESLLWEGRYPVCQMTSLRTSGALQCWLHHGFFIRWFWIYCWGKILLFWWFQGFNEFFYILTSSRVWFFLQVLRAHRLMINLSMEKPWSGWFH